MLGARIASELKLLDISRKIDGGQDGPKKRGRVIIHCSPYLRCLQTAIAVSAGLQEPDPRPIRLPPALKSGSKLDNEIKEEDEDQHDTSSQASKPLLRLDCFLEEWRSAGYFEKSMPPAPSNVLLATAREYLRKPAEELRGADVASPPIDELAAIDWDEKATEVSAIPTHEKAGLRQQISKRARHLSDLANDTRPTRLRSRTIGYNPPVPTYALAPSDAIPAGFVAHARDACIEVDYDWDSLREWGDGGVWDEEWGSMHRRVGGGLQKLLQYYENAEEDITIVLVTHQACCNALIRRMTGAPALHDIGTASLTLGVRRADSTATNPQSPTTRRGSLDGGIAHEFDMKIIASTEHLRGGSNPLGLNSPRLGRSPAFASRRIVGADSPEGFTLGDPWRPYAMTRSFSHRSSEADLEPPIPEGLWNSGGTPGSGRNGSVGSVVEEAPAEETQLWGSVGEGDRKLPVRSATQKGASAAAGMWGGGGGGSSITRDRSPGKRRWTAVDRSP